MRSLLIALACLGILPLRADDLPTEVLLLSRFKQKVRQDIEKLANCTCIETMERSVRPPAADSYQFLDRLRLEVTHAGGRELLAWPGGARFEEQDVKSFVSSGVVAAGMFVELTRLVLVGDRSNFQYRGPETLAGRRATRYDFRISSLAGGYKLGSGRQSAWVGSKGSFWFDPDSLALIRLDVFADDIPSGLDLIGALTRIQYEKMRVANQEFLAPEMVEIVLRHPSGETRRNTVQFANCREYTADSSISFGGPESEATSSHDELAPVELPPDLKMRLELEDGLGSATAAIGDPLHARVTEDVRRGGQVIVPKGAVVTGRVYSMQRPQRGAGFLIGIELTELRWAKSRAAFHARLLEVQADSKASRSKENDAANITGLAGGSINATIPSVEQSAKNGASGALNLCTLFLKDDEWRISAGLRMLWRTVTP